MKRNARERAICFSAVANCMLMLIILSVISLGIARIVIGFKHISKCDGQRMIPTYLIVSGISPVLISAFRRSQYTKDDESIKRRVAMSLGIIGIVFNIAWLIAGSIWVYGTYKTGRCIHRESEWSSQINITTTDAAPVYDVNGTNAESVLQIKAATILQTRDTTKTVLRNTNLTTVNGNRSLWRTTYIPSIDRLKNDTVLKYEDDNQSNQKDRDLINSTIEFDIIDCVICDEYLLAFSFAMVTFDWTLFGLLIIYIFISCLRHTLKYLGDYDCPFM